MNDINNARITLTKKETSPVVWEAVKFVARAVSTDSTRYHMYGIYFENDMLISTDGRRMHIYTDTEGQIKAFFDKKLGVDIEALKGSAWHVKHNSTMLSIGEKIDDKFPDWRRVLPPTEKPICGIEAPNGKLGITAALFPLYEKHIRCDGKYVADLTGYKIEGWSVYQSAGQGKAVKFIYKNYTAVIMPMQDDETEGERVARMAEEPFPRHQRFFDEFFVFHSICASPALFSVYHTCNILSITVLKEGCSKLAGIVFPPPFPYTIVL
jgi:hypothetical protein